MEIEREKTFLLNKLPIGIALGEPTLVEDYYLPENATHPDLRLRRKQSPAKQKFEITRKRPVADNVSCQVEQTIELSAEEYQELSSGLKRKVVKHRYLIEVAGSQAELDVFVGEHRGLILCDFEFADDQAMAEFTAPEWVLADVTFEDAIAGGILSGLKRERLFAILEQKYGLRV